MVSSELTPWSNIIESGWFSSWVTTIFSRFLSCCDLSSICSSLAFCSSRSWSKESCSSFSRSSSSTCTKDLEMVKTTCRVPTRVKYTLSSGEKQSRQVLVFPAGVILSASNHCYSPLHLDWDGLNLPVLAFHDHAACNTHTCFQLRLDWLWCFS